MSQGSPNMREKDPNDQWSARGGQMLQRGLSIKSERSLGASKAKFRFEDQEEDLILDK